MNAILTGWAITKPSGGIFGPIWDTEKSAIANALFLLNLNESDEQNLWDALKFEGWRVVEVDVIQKGAK